MGPDLSRSRAVLIGNGRYRLPGIPALPSAPVCVAAMKDLLTSELCGWPEGSIVEMLDYSAPNTAVRKLVSVVDEAQDVLLVYYIGHGLRTSEGRLALALADTDVDFRLLNLTSLVYEELARILRGPARTKLVILDCCHAELANRSAWQWQDAELIDEYPVEGMYFIGASRRDEKAKSPRDGGLSYFTAAFIEVVRAGLPGKPPLLRLDQIFEEVRRRLTASGRPEPVESGSRGAHMFPFARNAAPVETIIDPDVEIARLRWMIHEGEHRERDLRSQLTKTAAVRADELRSESERLHQMVEALDSERRKPNDEKTTAVPSTVRRSLLRIVGGLAAVAAVGSVGAWLVESGDSSNSSDIGNGAATNAPSATTGAEATDTAAAVATSAKASVLKAAVPKATWSCTLNSNTIQQTVVSGSTLFVTGYTSTSAGNGAGGCVLYAIDTVHGTVLWRKPFPGDMPAYTLDVADDVVLVANEYNASSSGSEPDQALLAYETASGASAWQSTATDISGPTVSGTVVYLVTADSSGTSHLLALDVTSGSNSWSPISLDTGFAAGPLVSGDNVCVPIGNDSTASSYVTSYDGRTGAKLWTSSTIAADELAGMGVDDGVLVFATSSTNSNSYYGVDSQTGDVLWQSAATFSESSFVLSGPSDGVLLVGDALQTSGSFDALYCLSSDSGKTSWTFKRQGQGIASGMAASNVAYVSTNPTGTGTAALTALNLTTGAQNWTTELSGDTATAAVILNNILYVASYNESASGAGEGGGALYALNASDGSVLQRLPAAGTSLYIALVSGSTLYLNATTSSGSCVVSAYDI